MALAAICNAGVCLLKQRMWQGLIALATNPVIADGIAGLATSATAHATVEVGPRQA